MLETVASYAQIAHTNSNFLTTPEQSVSLLAHQGITQMKYLSHASNAIRTALCATAQHSMIASLVILLSTLTSRSSLYLHVGYPSAGMGSFPSRRNNVMMEILLILMVAVAHVQSSQVGLVHLILSQWTQPFDVLTARQSVEMAFA